MKVTEHAESFVVEPHLVEGTAQKESRNEVVVGSRTPAQLGRKRGQPTRWNYIVRGAIYALTFIDAIIIGLLLNYWLFNRATDGRPDLASSTQPNVAVVNPAVADVPIKAEVAQTDAKITLVNGFVCPKIQVAIATEMKSLRILTLGNQIPADMLGCFEKMLKVQVELVAATNGDDFLEALSSAKPPFDLVLGAEHQMVSPIGKKQFQPLDHSRLPVLSQLNPAFLNQQFDPANKYTLPFQSGSIGIAYDDEAIQTAPTSWKDLWNPAYAGRVTIPNDSRAMVGIALSTLLLDVNSKVQSRLERTREPLTQLLASVSNLQTNDAFSALLNHTADIGVMTSGDAQRAKRINPAIDFVYPQEGALLWHNHYAILADAANGNAAYAWINYTMQDDLFWLVIRQTPGSIANDTAVRYARQYHSDLYDEYLNSPILNPGLTTLDKGMRLRDAGDFTSAYSKLWSEVLATAKITGSAP